MFDREAERRSRLDLSWKAALDLPLNHRGIPHVCLTEFRALLLRAGMEGFLHATLLGVPSSSGTGTGNEPRVERKAAQVKFRSPKICRPRN